MRAARLFRPVYRFAAEPPPAFAASAGAAAFRRRYACRHAPERTRLSLTAPP